METTLIQFLVGAVLFLVVCLSPAIVEFVVEADRKEDERIKRELGR